MVRCQRGWLPQWFTELLHHWRMYSEWAKQLQSHPNVEFYNYVLMYAAREKCRFLSKCIAYLYLHHPDLSTATTAASSHQHCIDLPCHSLPHIATAKKLEVVL